MIYGKVLVVCTRSVLCFAGFIVEWLLMKRHISLMIMILSLALLSLGLVFLLNIISPSGAGPAGILAAFGLIYGISWLALMIIAGVLEIIYRTIKPKSTTPIAQEKSLLARKRLSMIAAALSFVPIFIVSLNSIGQLKFTDVVLIVVIEALAIFYIVRRV